LKPNIKVATPTAKKTSTGVLNSSARNLRPIPPPLGGILIMERSKQRPGDGAR
jgi:hypothetical protein